jgi:hypothetical protein
MTDNIDREIFDELFVHPLAKTPEQPDTRDGEGDDFGSFLLFLAAITIAATICAAAVVAIIALLIAAFDWWGLAFVAGLLVATWALTKAARR